jgi:ParB-like chromosome segregation protein Spo0J
LGKPDREVVEEIARSMEENGWDGPPIDVIEGGAGLYVLDGHHRIAAARKAGIKVRVRKVSIKDLPAYGYRNLADVVLAADNREKDTLWAK